MRRQRGLTLVELLTGIIILSLVTLTSTAFLLSGLRSFQRTTSDTTLHTDNAQGLRFVSETLRSAMSITISADGKTISYTLPARSASNDPITGEKEYIDPLTSDGIARSFVVNTSTGRLTLNPGGRVLVKNITDKDPEPGSSQYNMAYQPFQLTTIGSQRAVSINLITQERLQSGVRNVRMKTTAVVRNGI